MWEWEILSFPLVFICYIIYGCINRYAYCGAELTVDRDTYKYLPLYHVQFRFQCIKLCMNQFSNTQRSIPTASYDELRWISVSNKLSSISILQNSDFLSEAKCSLCVVAVFRVHSVESAEGVRGEEAFDIYWGGEG